MTFDEWFRSKQGDPYDSMYAIAQDAWKDACGERDALQAELTDLRIKLDNATLGAEFVNEENDRLQTEINRARADERQAMAYLSQIRDVIGGADYPHTVKIAHGLKKIVDEMEEQEPITAVQNDYNADGRSQRIYDYLPAGTQLYAAPTPPSVPEITEAMVEAYLTANDAYWKERDKLPKNPSKWRNGTPSEATWVSLRAALAAAPQSVPAIEPLYKLLEYADESDGAQYGTLSTSLVRDLVNEALAAAPKPGEPS